MLRTTIAVIAALTVTAMTQSATAAPGDFAHRITVHYQDLNIDSAEGRAILQKRIERAAVLACGGSPYVIHGKPFRPMSAFDQCRAGAVNQAYAAIDVQRRHLANLGNHAPSND